MAVVKANYVKKGEGERGRAKATIKYIQHRPGKDKERKARTLFGIDGPIGVPGAITEKCAVSQSADS
jgi:hypothetical protein